MLNEKNRYIMNKKKITKSVTEKKVGLPKELLDILVDSNADNKKQELKSATDSLFSILYPHNFPTKVVKRILNYSKKDLENLISEMKTVNEKYNCLLEQNYKNPRKN